MYELLRGLARLSRIREIENRPEMIEARIRYGSSTRRRSISTRIMQAGGITLIIGLLIFSPKILLAGLFALVLGIVAAVIEIILNR